MQPTRFVNDAKAETMTNARLMVAVPRSNRSICFC
jgi:hypothetical protein